MTAAGHPGQQSAGEIQRGELGLQAGGQSLDPGSPFPAVEHEHDRAVEQPRDIRRSPPDVLGPVEHAVAAGEERELRGAGGHIVEPEQALLVVEAGVEEGRAFPPIPAGGRGKRAQMVVADLPAMRRDDLGERAGYRVRQARPMGRGQ